jgi:hypothetical protein
VEAEFLEAEAEKEADGFQSVTDAPGVGIQGEAEGGSALLVRV